MRDAERFPRFPRLGAALLAPLPLFPLSLMLGRLARAMAARHPGLFGRLGAHAGKRFLIDPTDLPMAFLLEPAPEAPRIRSVRRGEGTGWDCRIAGPLAALLGLVHGTCDGDALFFSREIVMEGDTEAALALRNALDDAELDLCAEAFATLGPVGHVAGQALRPAAELAARLSGVALTRRVAR
jgi:predicted lipid carrier protein YhbT